MSETTCPNCGAFAGDWRKIGGRQEREAAVKDSLTTDARIAALKGLKPYVLRWELGQPGGRVVVEFETDLQMSAILAALTQPPKEA